MLAADVALGVVAALLVLAQAVLLARVAARAFGGAGLAEVALPLALFVAATAGRAAAAWGFEAVGRRAAIDVLSELRLAVVDAATSGRAGRARRGRERGGRDRGGRRRGRPGDGLRQDAAAARAGRRRARLRDRRRRLDRPALGGDHAAHTPAHPASSCGSSGAALPGGARSRWQALTLLATHFLDVVRGLPTLRAFNRGEAQAETIALVTEEYRRATMGTLRIAFLSGAVLELAATLGIALVAVTVGVRLVDGGIGLEPALTVLVLAPELYLPLRSLAAQFHAGADGLAVAGRLLDLADGPSPAAASASTPPSPRLEPHPLRRRLVRVPGSRGSRARLGRPRARPGRDGGPRRPERRRQEHARRAAPAARSSRRKAGSRSETSTSATATLAAWRAQVAWVPQQPTLFHATVADNIRLGDPSADDATRARRRRAGRRRPFRRGTARRLRDDHRRRRPAAVCRRAAAASRSRAPSSAMRLSSCSTSRPRISTPESAAVDRRGDRAAAPGRTVLHRHAPAGAGARRPIAWSALVEGTVADERRPRRRDGRRYGACSAWLTSPPGAPGSSCCSACWPWASASGS